MLKEPSASPEIVITRHAGPDGPVEMWRICESSGGWNATGPDGGQGDSFPTVVEALIDSGAARFAKGAALDIQTAGLVSPFDLLPALAAWADAPGDLHSGAADWTAHPRIRWIESTMENFGRGWSIDYGRLIRIDDNICGVYAEHDVRQRLMERHLVVLKRDDPVWPLFYDSWASTSTDNGWGMAMYEIGEITPGFEGDVQHIDQVAPEIRISRLPENHPAGLYDAMVSWIEGLVSNTYGCEDSEVEPDDDGVEVMIPKGAHVEIDTSSFGPTVMRSRSL